MKTTFRSRIARVTRRLRPDWLLRQPIRRVAARFVSLSEDASREIVSGTVALFHKLRTRGPARRRGSRPAFRLRLICDHGWSRWKRGSCSPRIRFTSPI